MHVRASARTNGGKSAASTNPGTSSKPTNPSVCGTQAKGCFRGPGSALTTSLVGLGPPLVCRYLSTVCGLLAWLAGGSRKRPFAKRSARSLWGEGTGRHGLPCGRSEHGAMTRVCGRASGCLKIESERAPAFGRNMSHCGNGYPHCVPRLCSTLVTGASHASIKGWPSPARHAHRLSRRNRQSGRSIPAKSSAGSAGWRGAIRLKRLEQGFLGSGAKRGDQDTSAAGEAAERT